MAIEMHQVQVSILKELLFHNGATFSSLNRTGLDNNHFTFHVNHLVKSGLMEKKEGVYFLTQEGKQIAGKIDIDTNKLAKYGAPGVIVVAAKIVDKQKYYLVQKRLKEPFYGFFGFVNGKVRFGEMTINTARRELTEETGITGDPKLIFINHKINGPVAQEIKLDNYFFVYLVENPVGEPKNTAEGEHTWKTIEEIRYLQTFPGFNSVLDAVENPQGLTYLEQFVQLKNI